jgi:hypothetical protein
VAQKHDSRAACGKGQIRKNSPCAATPCSAAQHEQITEWLGHTPRLVEVPKVFLVLLLQDLNLTDFSVRLIGSRQGRTSLRAKDIKDLCAWFPVQSQATAFQQIDSIASKGDLGAGLQTIEHQLPRGVAGARACVCGWESATARSGRC